MGPFGAFIAVWTVVIGLHTISILDFYEPFSLRGVGFIVGSAAISWAIAKWFLPRIEALSHEQALNSVRRAERFRNAVYLLAAGIFLFESIVFEGVPLVWMMTGVPKGYADFGYPTMHGIFNGMWMFVTTASGAFAVLGSKRRLNSVLFLLGVVIMVLLYSRAMLVITIIQVAGVVLFRIRSQLTIPRAGGLLAITLGALFVFGVLGNIRTEHEYLSLIAAPVPNEGSGSQSENMVPAEAGETSSRSAAESVWSVTAVGYNPFIAIIADDRRWMFQIVPTEFLWGYSYITSGYNNLLSNLDIAPTMTPATTFSKLVPTVLYSAVGVEKRVDNFVRPNYNFTVSTAFAAPVSDFGHWGFLIVVPLLVGAAAAHAHAKAGNARAVLLYAMLFQSILLTPYIDTVLYTTFALQLLLALLAGVDFKKIISRT